MQCNFAGAFIIKILDFKTDWWKCISKEIQHITTRNSWNWVLMLILCCLHFRTMLLRIKILVMIFALIFLVKNNIFIPIRLDKAVQDDISAKKCSHLIALHCSSPVNELRPLWGTGPTPGHWKNLWPSVQKFYPQWRSQTPWGCFDHPSTPEQQKIIGLRVVDSKSTLPKLYF